MISSGTFRSRSLTEDKEARAEAVSEESEGALEVAVDSEVATEVDSEVEGALEGALEVERESPWSPADRDMRLLERKDGGVVERLRRSDSEPKSLCGGEGRDLGGEEGGVKKKEIPQNGPR